MTETQEQQKILWFFITSALLLTLPYIFIYWYLGAHIASVAILGTIPFLLLAVVVWRVSHSSFFAGNWVVAAGFCLFLVSSFFTGGIEAPALSWSIAIPIVATLLCGWRSGVFWLVLVLLKISGFYWAERAGYHFVQQYPDSKSLKASYYLTIMGITFFTFCLALVSEYFKQRYLRRIEESNRLLTEALENIKTLKGLLPICAWCKKIRDDKGYWSQVETYVSGHTGATFSHSMCPECKNREMGKINKNG